MKTPEDADAVIATKKHDLSLAIDGQEFSRTIKFSDNLDSNISQKDRAMYSSQVPAPKEDSRIHKATAAALAEAAKNGQDTTSEKKPAAKPAAASNSAALAIRSHATSGPRRFVPRAALLGKPPAAKQNPKNE
jgi:hypothetical protein